MQEPACRAFLRVALIICALSIATVLSPAANLPHKDEILKDEILGELQQYRVRENESLVEIARRFDLGYNAIVAANPGVDPFIPQAGTLIAIPTAWILPDVSARPAIVVNLPEYRLYYLPKRSSGEVVTFPLGIGDEGTDTPLGNYTVTEKIAGPAWHVPESIRAKERHLPKVVPPGPDNPLGSHALRLSRASVLIHGTNRPWGIGRRSSHGCLRLYPEDIVRLYRLISEGMRVIIVNQPIKVSGKGLRVIVEVHPYEPEESSVGQVMQMLADKELLGMADFTKLIRAIEEKRGVPVDVTISVGK
jgi:L,D-transpeptidase ErfK/SrfK